MRQKKSYINSFMVGADPEFAVLGCARTVHNVSLCIPPDGAVGSDHAGHVIELRPQPSHRILTLLVRIHNLLMRAHIKYNLNGFFWTSYPIAYLCHPRPTQNVPGKYVSLGGHIHFGDLPGYTATLEQKSIHTYRRDMSINILDDLYDILLVEGVFPKEACKKRTMFGYGRKREYRTDTYRQTWEYRRFPSWLVHPVLAFKLLTLAKLVACSPETFVSCKSLGQFWDMTNLFATFDGDARILKLLLHRDFDAYSWEKDFKHNWQLGFDSKSQEGGTLDKKVLHFHEVARNLLQLKDLAGWPALSI